MVPMSIIAVSLGMGRHLLPGEQGQLVMPDGLYKLRLLQESKAFSIGGLQIPQLV